MNEEENLQQKYMEFQQIQQQIERINEHTQLLQQQIAELEISIESLHELGKTKVNTEVLAPLATGIFLKSSLKDNKKLVLNVGAGTVVEKTIPETVRLLEEQKKDVIEKMVGAESVLQEMQGHALKIYQEINQSEK